MYCENKNKVLDLFFNEGSQHHKSEIRGHVENCAACREYLTQLKNTSEKLDRWEDERPSSKVFENILADVSSSIPKPVRQKQNSPLLAILQIAFGELFLIAIIYILNMKLTLAPFWNSIRNNWLVDSIGSVGIAVIIVLIAGTFIALSLAPILLYESRKKSFN